MKIKFQIQRMSIFKEKLQKHHYSFLGQSHKTVEL